MQRKGIAGFADHFLSTRGWQRSSPCLAYLEAERQVWIQYKRHLSRQRDSRIDKVSANQHYGLTYDPGLPDVGGDANATLPRFSLSPNLPDAKGQQGQGESA